MTDYPHVPAAFINAISEEGTKAEAVAFLQKQWNESCALRAELKALRTPAAGVLIPLELFLTLRHAFGNAGKPDSDIKDGPFADYVLGMLATDPAASPAAAPMADEIKRVDVLPPEAYFTSSKDMLAYLNDEPAATPLADEIKRVEGAERMMKFSGHIAGAKIDESRETAAAPPEGVREALADAIAKRFPALLSQYSQYTVADFILTFFAPSALPRPAPEPAATPTNGETLYRRFITADRIWYEPVSQPAAAPTTCARTGGVCEYHTEPVKNDK